MLESTIELVGDLLLSALALLIGFCVFGSIIAALRAVSRGSATARQGKYRIGAGSTGLQVPDH